MREKKDKFFPTNLQGVLTVLALIGLPVTAAWTYLPQLWEASDSEVPIKARQLLLVVFGIIGCTALLLWASRRRRAPRPKPLPPLQLSAHEEHIIKMMSVVQYGVPSEIVEEKSGIGLVSFRYAWHRLVEELRMIEQVDRHLGSDRFALSQRGRKYALEHDLVIKVEPPY